MSDGGNVRSAMKDFAFRSISLSLAVTFGVSAFSGIGLPLQKAEAKNTPGEFVKYFNPIPEKKHYLNEGQDRLIKTKKFKAVAIEGAQPVFNKEIGLFALIPTDKIGQTQAITEILNRPNISGLSVTIPWKVLEPKEDEFNWQPLDSLLELLKPSGKTLILRVSTCGIDTVPEGYVAPKAEEGDKKVALDSDTPSWVFNGDVKTMEYTGKDGKQHLMPIFWDTNYLAKWSNFITEMGEKYDKNPNIHSIGITGGGVGGSTLVVPDVTGEKGNYSKLETALIKDHGMSQRQLVTHWKYVADIFPKAFPTARLNFDVDPPTQNRPGQDTLDEISDYLIYRYGQRVYITRQNVNDGKHGFDQYRVIIKFHPDTFTGYQLTEKVDAEGLEKIAKNAPVDGISFVEIPLSTLESAGKDEVLSKSLEELRSKLGYQLVSQKISFDEKLKQGEKLKASFEFLNLGAATPLRPSREFDKDVAGSYKLQMEFRDETGRPIGQSLHTPQPPTNQWQAGKPITWSEELKMPPLKPGKYSVFVSVVDVDTKRKLQILNASNTQGKPTAEFAIAAGDLKVE
ncbi:MAG: hypothetical protein DKT66_01215 [Candidatus Melainabacteria bacterium]|nr:MAG: hypothetical protein DKT66_01215 [Candidatus Melainabacteria bacterium]